jgi:hypothetical protein
LAFSALAFALVVQVAVAVVVQAAAAAAVLEDYSGQPVVPDWLLLPAGHEF